MELDLNSKKLDKELINMIYKKELLILTKGDKDEIKKLSHLIQKYDTKNLRISGGVNRLVVMLTHSCQLKCKYCSVRKFDSEMSPEILFKAIDLLFTSNKDNIQLQFFGGEPLLKFDLVKQGVTYAEKKSEQTRKNIEFILTTNGILLTKDKLEYFKGHNFTIEFSLDGDIETQLKSRSLKNGGNYYQLVLDNLKDLARSNIRYYIISVVTPSNVHNLFNNFKYLYDFGFRNLQINYSLGVVWPKEKIKELFKQLEIIKSESENLTLINSLKTRREPVVLNAELTVDCDGIIYLETGICLEKDFSQLKKDFKVGDLDSIEDINSICPMRSDTFRRLVEVYTKKDEKFREVILNNIWLGKKMINFFKSG